MLVTIKKRLILSHILVFVVPIFMTVVLFLMAAGGIWLFTQSGNHVYVESSTQFNRASEAVHHVVFRSLHSSGDDPEHYKWIIEMLSPEQSYVVLEKDGSRIYEYGNGHLASMMEAIPSDIRGPVVFPSETGYVRPRRYGAVLLSGKAIYP